jgi:hypothetical protein
MRTDPLHRSRHRAAAAGEDQHHQHTMKLGANDFLPALQPEEAVRQGSSAGEIGGELGAGIGRRA